MTRNDINNNKEAMRRLDIKIEQRKIRKSTAMLLTITACICIAVLTGCCVYIDYICSL